MLLDVTTVPVFVLILALIIALLSIPLSMNFSFITTENIQCCMRFNWLFGLLKFQSQFPKQPKPQLSAAVEQKKQSNKNKPNHAINQSITLFNHSRFRRHLIHFIKRILRATHAKNLYLKLRIGLGDPADTGALWAMMGPISGLLPNLKSIQIELEPDFIDTVMEIESHGQFRIIPLQLIVLILVFLLSPTTIHAWRLSQH